MRTKKEVVTRIRKLPPQRSSLSLKKRVIDIISLTLGCVELFFEREADERAYPVS